VGPCADLDEDAAVLGVGAVEQFGAQEWLEEVVKEGSEGGWLGLGRRRRRATDVKSFRDSVLIGGDGEEDVCRLDFLLQKVLNASELIGVVGSSRKHPDGLRNRGQWKRAVSHGPALRGFYPTRKGERRSVRKTGVRERDITGRDGDQTYSCMSIRHW
jgi:hypothetical protein